MAVSSTVVQNADGTYSTVCTVSTSDGTSYTVTNCTRLDDGQDQTLSDILSTLKSIDGKTTAGTQDVSGTVTLTQQQANDLHDLNIEGTFISTVFFPACVMMLIGWYVISRFMGGFKR